MAATASSASAQLVQAERSLRQSAGDCECESLTVSDLTRNHGEIKRVNKPPKTRGGRRKGAGRKPKWEKALQKHVAKPITAAIVLAEHDELRLWGRFLSSPDARIALDAAKYLTDRRDGKAKQAIEHLGPDGGPLQAAVLVKFVESEK